VSEIADDDVELVPRHYVAKVAFQAAGPKEAQAAVNRMIFSLLDEEPLIDFSIDESMAFQTVAYQAQRYLNDERRPS
jgi:hypothetical protein